MQKLINSQSQVEREPRRRLLGNSPGLGIVPHGMWGDRFRNTAEVMRFLTGLPDSVPRDVLARDITRK
jgi:hypothetical protein